MSWQAPPPDPTNPNLLGNLRQLLINNGLVRDPRDGTTTLPPCWISPRFGVPAPGQTDGLKSVEVGPNMVVGLNPRTGIPSARYEGFMRVDHVEVVFRARTAEPIQSLENSIRALVSDKRGWMMVNMPVNESLLFSGLQFLASDNLGFVFREEYSFNIQGPFTPVGP